MEHKLRKLMHGKALLLIIVLGIGGSFQHGYQITVISSPSMYIKDFINKTWEERYEQPIKDGVATFLWSSVVGFYGLGGFAGSLSVSFITAKFGRKRAMIWNNVISITAAIFMLTSKTAKSFEMVFIARFLYGLSAGLGVNVQSIYLGESCLKEVRGMVILTAATFFSMGKFCGQFIGLGELLGREHLWHILLSFSSCFAVVHLLLLPFLPEAPRYLVIERNDKELCRKALQSLWGEGNYKVEIEEMLLEQAAIRGKHTKNMLELLRDRSVRWQVITVVVISISMHLSGSSVVNVFTFSIFTEAGVPLDKIPYVTLGLGISEVTTSVTCGFLIENMGRRALLWRAFGSLSVIMALITVTLTFKDSTYWIPYCTVALVFLFVIFHGGGAAGVVIPFIHESFVQSHRPAAFALVGCLRWFEFWVIGTVFPFLLVSFIPSYYSLRVPLCGAALVTSMDFPRYFCSLVDDEAISVMCLSSGYYNTLTTS
ncbi:solute carrier family 2 member 9, like 1 [Scleropages formosus]|uniref:solute carrier family 2 member 9, like 1 n=1 Tax=Scleropages formosus TaxID=113540 RepID=UPI000878A36C|nr:solute carrier family 2, facilitated glucose transporter member 11-like [Scleropages formosus]